MSTVSAALGAARRMTVTLVALVGIALVGTTPARAHHAFAAEYDADKPVEVTGIVTKAKWVNPHSRLFVDVKSTDGTVTNWSFEFGAPNSLEDHGLTKADLQPGAQVQIKGYRSKNGGPFGYSVTLILADGRSFKTGGAADAPQQSGPKTQQPSTGQ
jgi:Family of unknown function (DUF6152)